MKKVWAKSISGLLILPLLAQAEGEWEVTPASEKAIDRGLEWLARTQGPAGNWDCNDLGLVSFGALAFMAAGHLPDRGRYGTHVRRALDYVVINGKPSGLLNIAGGRRDMYNHGLTVFVLSQAYGMTNDRRIGKALDRGVKLILDVQCEDGGWAYEAIRKQRGADLSLAVMQAKAIRSAMDIGLEIPPDRVDMALQFIRKRYKNYGQADGIRYGNNPLSEIPGAFTYNGNNSSTAMAAAGPVCLQEFGKYEDFRIQRSMDRVQYDIDHEMEKKLTQGQIPFDAYAMCYVAQALYQVGGGRWKAYYPKVRDAIVNMQAAEAGSEHNGSWGANGRVGGKTGQLYGTSVAVFALAMPNRYLPIL
ncbi:MAG: prenyltransferase/squalene oxidase repeat-containing protein, partial [Verrucomicrobiota bacterium]